MKTTQHIVFAGGGTAGHLFPGLAVAEKLVGQSSRRADHVRRHRQAAGTRIRRPRPASSIVSLPSRPMPRKASEALSFVVENMAGYFAAGRFLDEENVAGVVGLGGYASVPLGRAAARRRLPLVLLEQNAVLGRANRWLSRFASAALHELRRNGTNRQRKCATAVPHFVDRKSDVSESPDR